MAKVSMQALVRACWEADAALEAATDTLEAAADTDGPFKLERARDRAAKRCALAFKRLLAARPVTIADALDRIDELVRQAPFGPAGADECLAADAAFIRQTLKLPAQMHEARQ